MNLIGAIIVAGAGLAFLAVGLLAIFGSLQATRGQLVPGFRPDQPGPAERTLSLLAVWGSALLVALLSILAAGKLLSVALGAL